MRTTHRSTLVCLLGAALWGCDGGSSEEPTATVDARPSADAASSDARPEPDAQPQDARPQDAQPQDGDLADSGPRDSALPDAGPSDAALPDGEPPDLNPPDAGAPDADLPDVSPPDASPPPRPGVGEPCRPEGPACAPGALCIAAPEAREGVCRDRCDTARPEDCPGTALCVTIDPARPAEGWCLGSEQCGTRARERCPEGLQGTCVTQPPFSWCARSGLAGLDEPCVADPNGVAPPGQLCGEGLFCHYERCKQPCAPDGACNEGEICVDYTDRLDGVEYRFCHGPCDPLDPQSCGAGAQCVVVDQHEGAMVGACVSARGEAPGAGVQGDPCTLSNVTASGTCRSDHLCAPVGPDWLTRCVAWCDRAQRAPCGAGSTCVLDVMGHGRTATGPLAHVGVCVGDCDPLSADETCGDALRCVAVHEGIDALGRAALAGWCRPLKDDPEAPPLGQCAIDEDTGSANCPHGFACVADEEGEAPTCQALCRMGDAFDDCPPPRRCAPAITGLGEVGLCR